MVHETTWQARALPGERRRKAAPSRDASLDSGEAVTCSENLEVFVGYKPSDYENVIG